MTKIYPNKLLKSLPILSLLIVLVSSNISCVKAQPNQNAVWYSYPSANNTTYGVYHFRKNIQLQEIPDKLELMVSADNRYNLFVNGQRVAYGPAKGDLKTYKYDVVDIAPYLKSGKNTIAALVYNGGKDKPLAFVSSQTAFLCQPKDKSFETIFFRQIGSALRMRRIPLFLIMI